MIEFKVIIRSMPNGKVSCSCETFPGMANQAEHDLAHAFMEMFKTWTQSGNGSIVVQDFKGSNDAKRN